MCLIVLILLFISSFLCVSFQFFEREKEEKEKGRNKKELIAVEIHKNRLPKRKLNLVTQKYNLIDPTNVITTTKDKKKDRE